jgi:hypothetical protein
MLLVVAVFIDAFFLYCAYIVKDVSVVLVASMIFNMQHKLGWVQIDEWMSGSKLCYRVIAFRFLGSLMLL